MPAVAGQAEVLAACCTSDSSAPVGFSTTAQVRGLAVTYAIQPALPSNPLLPSQGTPSAALGAVSNAAGSGHSPLIADFASCNIGQSRSLLLVVQNQTPLAASVSLWLETFQADLSSATVYAGSPTASNTHPRASSSAVRPAPASALFTLDQLLPNATAGGSFGTAGLYVSAAGLSDGSGRVNSSHTASHVTVQSADQVMTASGAVSGSARTGQPGVSVTGLSGSHKRKHSLVGSSIKPQAFACLIDTCHGYLPLNVLRPVNTALAGRMPERPIALNASLTWHFVRCSACHATWHLSVTMLPDQQTYQK